MRIIFKRLLCLALCVLCATQMILGVSAADQSQAQTEEFYLTKVYNRASSRAGVMGYMENGREVTVLGTVGEYYRVDCYEQTGYIPVSQITCENERYYVNCQGNSKHSKAGQPVALSEAMTLRSELLVNARAKLGCSYVYATAGPRTFDCSGFTSYIYKQSGYRLTRSSDSQPADGIIVSREGLQVGDLLFFAERNGRGIGHVGMYAGDGMMIHADSRGVVCTPLSERYYAQRFVCARRVIFTDATTLEDLQTTTVGTMLTRNNLSNFR